MTSDATATPSMLYLVKQLELAIRARLETVLKPAGVTSLQYTALTVLERRTGLSSAELARHSFVTAQSMQDLVGALERRGLIRRTEDPENKRRLRISLTDAGQALLDDHRGAVAELEALMVDGLSARAVADLRRTLIRCHHTLSETNLG